MTPADGVHNKCVPETVWVRHGEGTQQLSVFCPDSWPYSTTVIMRALHGGDASEASPRRVVMPDGREVRIAGSGLHVDDPMFCADLQGDPSPRCRCGYDHACAAEVAELSAERPAVQGEESTSAASCDGRLPSPYNPRRLTRQVYLPGDGPGRSAGLR